MEAIIDQVRKLAQSADEAGRQKIMLALRDASHAIETPRDTMARKNFPHLQIAASRIACDLQLYTILAAAEGPLTVQALAARTGAAESLLGRLLRYLASQGDVAEAGRDTFAANGTTRTMADPGAAGGIYLFWDSIGPAWQALPDWLAEHGYADVVSADDTPHQKGHATRLRAFDWAAQVRPDVYAHSHQYMKVQFVGLATWMDVYPWRRQLGLLPAEDGAAAAGGGADAADADRLLFVDVGGGIGHQCVALRERMAAEAGVTWGRVVVQDTAETLAHALAHAGVEALAHDMFTAQPAACRGAAVYYLRNVLHDHGDGPAAVLLGHLRAALAPRPGAVILADDMVLPDVGAHWHATALDLTMMSASAALERTRAQWDVLAARAGLRVRAVYPYTHVLQNSVVELVPV